MKTRCTLPIFSRTDGQIPPPPPPPLSPIFCFSVRQHAKYEPCVYCIFHICIFSGGFIPFLHQSELGPTTNFIIFLVIFWKIRLDVSNRTFMSIFVNSLTSTTDFCSLVITCYHWKQFGSRSGPTERQSWLWIQYVWHSNSVSKITFWKNDCLRKSAVDKKSWKITQHARS